MNIRQQQIHFILLHNGRKYSPLGKDGRDGLAEDLRWLFLLLHILLIPPDKI